VICYVSVLRYFNNLHTVTTNKKLQNTHSLDTRCIQPFSQDLQKEDSSGLMITTFWNISMERVAINILAWENTKFLPGDKKYGYLKCCFTLLFKQHAFFQFSNKFISKEGKIIFWLLAQCPILNIISPPLSLTSKSRIHWFYHPWNFHYKQSNLQ